jgi:hypothetical protein
MRWTVVVPGALLPAPIAADVIGAARAPQFARLIARARIEPPVPATPSTLGAAHWSWLWRRFAGRDDCPVTAPYAWRALGDAGLDGADDDGTLWQADPLHFALARDHLLALPMDGDDRLTREEALALAAEADACARGAGARLRLGERCGFLHVEAPWELQAAPLDAVVGESIQDRLPVGRDSARWRRLLTEIQIAWHHHPVNAAREARGARPVNGLWLHGGGAAGALPGCGLAQVACDEAAVQGWALAAGVPPAEVGPASTALRVRGDALAVWPQLFAACKAEAWQAWLTQFAVFDAWLDDCARGAFAAGAEVQLVLCGRQQTRTLLLGRADGWRLWRRAEAGALLSEPALEGG